MEQKRDASGRLSRATSGSPAPFRAAPLRASLEHRRPPICWGRRRDLASGARPPHVEFPIPRNQAGNAEASIFCCIAEHGVVTLQPRGLLIL